MYNLSRVIARGLLVSVLGCIMGSMMGPTGASAQQVGRMNNITANGVPYFVYAETGEPTIQVYVVGGGAGGIYEVGVGTPFDTFLALASIEPGTTGQTQQKVTVRLLRTNEAGERQVILEGQPEELLQADPETYPRLRDGDFINVEVSTRQRFGWRDGLQILTSLTSIIVLVDRLARF